MVQGAGKRSLRDTPKVPAISATVYFRLPSAPVASYMPRATWGCRAVSLGMRPPTRPRAWADEVGEHLIHRAQDVEGEPPGRGGGVDALILKCVVVSINPNVVDV
jgi:hypothetical protein